MLVLNRRVRQGIVIDDQILVTVLKVSGSEVRIGIAAPESIVIDREENHSAKQRDRANIVPAQLAYRWIDRLLEIGEEVRAAEEAELNEVAWDELGRARSHVRRAVEALREVARALERKGCTP